MTNAILTINIGDLPYTKYSIPTMKKYAKKIGVDFIEITERTIDRPPHLEKYQIGKLLERYDRILYVDSDVMINIKSPNIFEQYDEDLHVVFEDSIPRLPFENFDVLIKEFEKVYGDVDWKGGYFNSGVMLISKMHKKIFDDLKWFGKEAKSNFKDQTKINYLARKYKFYVKEMDFKWNYFGPYNFHRKTDLTKLNFVHFTGFQFCNVKFRIIPMKKLYPYFIGEM